MHMNGGQFQPTTDYNDIGQMSGTLLTRVSPFIQMTQWPRIEWRGASSLVGHTSWN